MNRAFGFRAPVQPRSTKHSDMALVHESAPAPTLTPARSSDPLWRPRGRRHGRREVGPSQPQVQDEVQNPELEGVRAWQKESGYRQQARAENGFFRYKSVLGGSLQARNSNAQAREAAIGCHILNRMAQLGRPKS